MSLEPTRMLMAAGVRDTYFDVTYLPWANYHLSILGFQIIPDEGASLIVYFVPDLNQVGKGALHVHASTGKPDPTRDKKLATIEIPPEMFK